MQQSADRAQDTPLWMREIYCFTLRKSYKVMVIDSYDDTKKICALRKTVAAEGFDDFKFVKVFDF